MADHTPAGPAELGADMDYSEHERTYNAFTMLAKYGSLVCAAILIAMAFGFFVGGFFSAPWSSSWSASSRADPALGFPRLLPRGGAAGVAALRPIEFQPKGQPRGLRGGTDDFHSS